MYENYFSLTNLYNDIAQFIHSLSLRENFKKERDKHGNANKLHKCNKFSPMFHCFVIVRLIYKQM